MLPDGRIESATIRMPGGRTSNNIHNALKSKFYFKVICDEFVSSSIPSWQILTAHAQPFRGARDLAFCLKVPLDSLLVWASSGGSGETARMRRLAWTFAARIGDKYQICLTLSICCGSIMVLTINEHFTFTNNHFPLHKWSKDTKITISLWHVNQSKSHTFRRLTMRNSTIRKKNSI